MTLGLALAIICCVPLLKANLDGQRGASLDDAIACLIAALIADAQNGGVRQSLSLALNLWFAILLTNTHGFYHIASALFAGNVERSGDGTYTSSIFSSFILFHLRKGNFCYSATFE